MPVFLFQDELLNLPFIQTTGACKHLMTKIFATFEYLKTLT